MKALFISGTDMQSKVIRHCNYDVYHLTSETGEILQWKMFVYILRRVSHFVETVTQIVIPIFNL
jgi:hypothetical protein